MKGHIPRARLLGNKLCYFIIEAQDFHSRRDEGIRRRLGKSQENRLFLLLLFFAEVSGDLRGANDAKICVTLSICARAFTLMGRRLES